VASILILFNRTVHVRREAHNLQIIMGHYVLGAPGQVLIMLKYWFRSECFLKLSVDQARNRVAKPQLKFFLPHGKCVGHNLKILDIVQKIWAPLRKLFAPPGVPSWLRACCRSKKTWKV